MALRNILFSDNPRLRKVSKPVKEINQRILTLLDDMAETMYQANGVGLAAPQVGVLKKVVVIDIGEGLIELINPEIINTEGEYAAEEGCLSVPDETGVVKRPEKVTVKALNRKREDIVLKGEGLLARAFCHELDHLEGILFIDKKIAESMDEYEGIDKETV